MQDYHQKIYQYLLHIMEAQAMVSAAFCSFMEDGVDNRESMYNAIVVPVIEAAEYPAEHTKRYFEMQSEIRHAFYAKDKVTGDMKLCGD
jgi:hypothetical protein